MHFACKITNNLLICDCILENHKNNCNPFLSVHESHTQALSRNTKHLSLDGQVCFYRRILSNTIKPQGCISWPVWPLRGINKTVWGAKLILTAHLTNRVSCASRGHLLMPQHCCLCLNVPPTAPNLPPPPTLLSFRPPIHYRFNQ